MHFNRIAAVNCDDICAFLMCSWIFPRSDLFPLIYVYFAWKSLFKLGNGNVCWNISITWLATDVCVHLSIVHIIQAQGTHIQTRTCVTSVNKYEQNSCRLIVCACVCVDVVDVATVVEYFRPGKREKIRCISDSIESDFLQKPTTESTKNHIHTQKIKYTYFVESRGKLCADHIYVQVPHSKFTMWHLKQHQMKTKQTHTHTHASNRSGTIWQ